MEAVQRYQAGIAAMGAKKFLEADAFFSEAIRFYPLSADYFYQRGLARLSIALYCSEMPMATRAQHFAGCLRDTITALKIDPTHEEATGLYLEARTMTAMLYTNWEQKVNDVKIEEMDLTGAELRAKEAEAQLLRELEVELHQEKEDAMESNLGMNKKLKKSKKKTHSEKVSETGKCNIEERDGEAELRSDVAGGEESNVPVCSRGSLEVAELLGSEFIVPAATNASQGSSGPVGDPTSFPASVGEKTISISNSTTTAGAEDRVALKISESQDRPLENVPYASSEAAGAVTRGRSTGAAVSFPSATDSNINGDRGGCDIKTAGSGDPSMINTEWKRIGPTSSRKLSGPAKTASLKTVGSVHLGRTLAPDAIITEFEHCSHSDRGYIIGKGGCVIDELKSRSCCSLSVAKDPLPGGGGQLHQITYTGTRQQIDLAKRMVDAVVSETGKGVATLEQFPDLLLSVSSGSGGGGLKGLDSVAKVGSAASAFAAASVVSGGTLKVNSPLVEASKHFRGWCSRGSITEEISKMDCAPNAVPLKNRPASGVKLASPLAALAAPWVNAAAMPPVGADAKVSPDLSPTLDAQGALVRKQKTWFVEVKEIGHDDDDDNTERMGESFAAAQAGGVMSTGSSSLSSVSQVACIKYIKGEAVAMAEASIPALGDCQGDAYGSAVTTTGTMSMNESEWKTVGTHGGTKLFRTSKAAATAKVSISPAHSLLSPATSRPAAGVDPDAIITELGQCSHSDRGYIIGKGGCVINELKARSCCSVSVAKDPLPGEGGQLHQITYTGTRQQIDLAKRMVDAVVSETGKGVATLDHFPDLRLSRLSVSGFVGSKREDRVSIASTASSMSGVAPKLESASVEIRLQDLLDISQRAVKKKENTSAAVSTPAVSMLPSVQSSSLQIQPVSANTAVTPAAWTGGRAGKGGVICSKEFAGSLPTPGAQETVIKMLQEELIVVKETGHDDNTEPLYDSLRQPLMNSRAASADGGLKKFVDQTVVKDSAAKNGPLGKLLCAITLPPQTVLYPTADWAARAVTTGLGGSEAEAEAEADVTSITYANSMSAVAGKVPAAYLKSNSGDGDGYGDTNCQGNSYGSAVTTGIMLTKESEWKTVGTHGAAKSSRASKAAVAATASTVAHSLLSLTASRPAVGVDPDDIITEFGHCSHSNRGYIVGKEGCVIDELKARSCCSVSVAKDPLPGGGGGKLHQITYTGTRQQIDLAKRMVEAVVAETGKGVATLDQFLDLRLSASAASTASSMSSVAPKLESASVEISLQDLLDISQRAVKKKENTSAATSTPAVSMQPSAQRPSMQIRRVGAEKAVATTPWAGGRAVKGGVICSKEFAGSLPTPGAQEMVIKTQQEELAMVKETASKAVGAAAVVSTMDVPPAHSLLSPSTFRPAAGGHPDAIITEFEHCYHSDRCFIVGKDGCVINELKARSCCSLSVAKDPLPGGGGQLHQITYTGTRQQIDLAKRMVEALVSETGKGVATLEQFPDLRLSMSNVSGGAGSDVANGSSTSASASASFVSSGTCEVASVSAEANLQHLTDISQRDMKEGANVAAATASMQPCAQDPPTLIQPVSRVVPASPASRGDTRASKAAVVDAEESPEPSPTMGQRGIVRQVQQQEEEQEQECISMKRNDDDNMEWLGELRAAGVVTTGFVSGGAVSDGTSVEYVDIMSVMMSGFPESVLKAATGDDDRDCNVERGEGCAVSIGAIPEEDSGWTTVGTHCTAKSSRSSKAATARSAAKADPDAIITEFGHCSHSDRGYIIGKEGCVINELKARSCCSVSVAKDPLPREGGQLHQITYTGTRQQIDLAKRMVDAVVSETGKALAVLDHFPDLRLSGMSASGDVVTDVANGSSKSDTSALICLNETDAATPGCVMTERNMAPLKQPAARMHSTQSHRAGSEMKSTTLPSPPWGSTQVAKDEWSIPFQSLLSSRVTPPKAIQAAAPFTSVTSVTFAPEQISTATVTPVAAPLEPASLLPDRTSVRAAKEPRSIFDVPPEVASALQGRIALFCQKIAEIFSVRISFDADGSRLRASCDGSQSHQLCSFAAFMTALAVQQTPARMLDAMIGISAVPEAAMAMGGGVAGRKSSEAAEPLIDVTAVFDDIIGADRRVANHLEREYGVSIALVEQQGRRMMALRGDPDAVDFARVAIMSILDHDGMRKWRQYLAEQREKMVHLFVDLDELLLPNLMECGTHNSHALKDFHGLLNASNLVDVVSDMRTVVRRTAVGSQLSEEHPVWAELQAAGFSTVQLRSIRHADGREFQESSELVLLHYILQDLLMHAIECRTIILVSRCTRSDSSSECTAYSYLIEAALQRFWQVELWSWRGEGVALYDGFSQRFPDHFSVRYLDEHFEFITSPFQHDQRFLSGKSTVDVLTNLSQSDYVRQTESNIFAPATHAPENDIGPPMAAAWMPWARSRYEFADAAIEDIEADSRPQQQQQQLYASASNDFECPILLSEMQDPVVAEDGYTYERRAIEEWLADHDISPIMGGSMGKTLVPNLLLRRLIQDCGNR